MAPITSASNDENHFELLDRLDLFKVQKPFRNPQYRGAQRRNKNLRQILSEAQRAQQSLINTQQNSGASTPQPTNGSTTPALNLNPAQGSQDLSRLVVEKNARATNGSPLPTVTYSSITAAPSLKPKKKYCDITGLPAKYKDPKSGLYYYNVEVYNIVRSLGTGQVQEYLAIRGANTVLK